MSARKQMMLDIFTTALEGGIGYWSQCLNYHWSNADGSEDFDGFYADILVSADDQLPFHTNVIPTPVEVTDYTGTDEMLKVRIDRKVILRGYDLAARRTEKENHHAWQCGCGRPPMVVTDESRDEWDFDSIDADAIVQLGLFGTVIYG